MRLQNTRRRDPRLAVLVMLQVLFLLSSVVLVPGLAVAESAQEQASTGSDAEIQLFPRRIAIPAGGTAAVSAWTCPSDAAASLGTDGVPGTGDDGCKPANGAMLSVGDASVAKLDNVAGNEAVVRGVSGGQTKLIAELAGLTASADIVVKAAPVLKPKAEEAKKSAKEPKQPQKDAKANTAKNNEHQKAEEHKQPKKAYGPKQDKPKAVPKKSEEKKAEEPKQNEP